MFVAKMKENGEIDKESIKELNCPTIENISKKDKGKIYGFAFPFGYDISNAENKYTALADICMQICEHEHFRDNMLIRLNLDGSTCNVIALYDCTSDSFEISVDFYEGEKSVLIEVITTVEMALDYFTSNLPHFDD